MRGGSSDGIGAEELEAPLDRTAGIAGVGGKVSSVQGGMLGGF